MLGTDATKPSVMMQWDAVRVRGGGDSQLVPVERQNAAKQQLDGALAAVRSGLPDVLQRLVCAGVRCPLRNWCSPGRCEIGKLVLRLALDLGAGSGRIG